MASQIPQNKTKRKIPRVAKHLSDVAKRTLDETQNRMVLAVLSGYFKTFIVDFSPNMMKVQSIMRGLNMHFPDPNGFFVNCAAVNSLMSPFWPESMMFVKMHITDMSFSAGLSGLTFSEAKLNIGKIEIDVCPPEQTAPRLRPDIEAKFLREWYGPEVNPNSASARITDGFAFMIALLKITFPGTYIFEFERCMSTNIDKQGSEVGLQRCWEEYPETDEKLVRKHMSCEQWRVNSIIVMPIGDEDPTAPPKEVITPFLTNTLLEFDMVITKKISTGEWADVHVEMDNPMFKFMFGAMPLRITCATPQAPIPSPEALPKADEPVKPKKPKKKGWSFLSSKKKDKTGEGSKDNKNQEDDPDRGSTEERNSLGVVPHDSVEGFICPECLRSFLHAEELTLHFNRNHPSEFEMRQKSGEINWEVAQDYATAAGGVALDVADNVADGVVDVADGVAGGMNSGMNWAAKQSEARLLKKTLYDLEQVAVEQPMAVLAVFAEGLDVFEHQEMAMEEEEDSPMHRVLSMFEDIEIASKNTMLRAEQNTKGFFKKVAKGVEKGVTGDDIKQEMNKVTTTFTNFSAESMETMKNLTPQWLDGSFLDNTKTNNTASSNTDTKQKRIGSRLG